MWFRVDDDLHSHPKTLAAGNAAMGAWVRIGSWCGKHGTGGSIPMSVARSLVGSSKALHTLVQVGLLNVDGENYQLHDWEEYNATAEEAQALKIARSEAGKAGARARWSDGKQHGKPHGKSHGKTIATAMAKRCPDPDPDPDLEQTHTSTSSPSEAPKAPSREPADVRAVFDVWRENTGHSRAKLDSNRAKRIKARLREGHTVDDLCDAIRGRKHDDWLMGLGKSTRVYDDVSTLLRDTEQVERLAALHRDGPAQKGDHTIGQPGFAQNTPRHLNPATMTTDERIAWEAARAARREADNEAYRARHPEGVGALAELEAHARQLEREREKRHG